MGGMHVLFTTLDIPIIRSKDIQNALAASR